MNFIKPSSSTHRPSVSSQDQAGGGRSTVPASARPTLMFTVTGKKLSQS